MSEHVHDCTGSDMRCPCGFVFRAARFCVSITVFDNDAHEELVSEGFNCDSVAVAVAASKESATEQAALLAQNAELRVRVARLEADVDAWRREYEPDADEHRPAFFSNIRQAFTAFFSPR